MKFLLVLFLLIPLAVLADWQGTVVGIADGDTVTVLNAMNKPIKVRLLEIDAPEKKQDFGMQSKKSLSDLCFKKAAVVVPKGRDKYGRTLGRLVCAGIDANAAQVKRGMAWAYVKYLTDLEIAKAEQTARERRIGLWSAENPLPPWDFRHLPKLK